MKPNTITSEMAAEQWAWESFADIHPHEAHAKWPDRFWDYFQIQRPGVTREHMVTLLNDTDLS